MTGVSLDEAPLGVRLTVRDSGGTGANQRRLAVLGLRRGASITVLQSTTGGGRVVEVGGSRIALGKSVLRQLQVAPA